MARRRKVEVRDAQEFKRDAGRLNALKGKVMADMAALKDALARAPTKAPKKARPVVPAAAGIRMGE